MNITNLELSAQCWCDEETSHIEMNTPLAMAFEARLNDKDEVIEKLKYMLDIAWDAVTEAQYDGFSNELRYFMDSN